MGLQNSFGKNNPDVEWKMQLNVQLHSVPSHPTI